MLYSRYCTVRIGELCYRRIHCTNHPKQYVHHGRNAVMILGSTWGAVDCLTSGRAGKVSDLIIEYPRGYCRMAWEVVEFNGVVGGETPDGSRSETRRNETHVVHHKWRPHNRNSGNIHYSMVALNRARFGGGGHTRKRSQHTVTYLNRSAMASGGEAAERPPSGARHCGRSGTKRSRAGCLTRPGTGAATKGEMSGSVRCG